MTALIPSNLIALIIAIVIVLMIFITLLVSSN